MLFDTSEEKQDLNDLRRKNTENLEFLFIDLRRNEIMERKNQPGMSKTPQQLRDEKRSALRKLIFRTQRVWEALFNNIQFFKYFLIGKYKNAKNNEKIIQKIINDLNIKFLECNAQLSRIAAQLKQRDAIINAMAADTEMEERQIDAVTALLELKHANDNRVLSE